MMKPLAVSRMKTMWTIACVTAILLWARYLLIPGWANLSFLAYSSDWWETVLRWIQPVLILAIPVLVLNVWPPKSDAWQRWLLALSPVVIVAFSLGITWRGNALKPSLVREESASITDLDTHPDWIVVGIDGTESDVYFRFLGTDHTGHRPNSHVFNFVNGVSPQTGQKVYRMYFHGPGTWSANNNGEDVEQITNNAVVFIRRSISSSIASGRTHRIAIVGHSRGGLVAVRVAEALNSQDPKIPKINVDFMGLFDAVNRGTPIPFMLAGVLGFERATVIPSNVLHAYHVVRDPDACSQFYFGNMALSVDSNANTTFALGMAPHCSHTAVGGDPWNQTSFDKWIMRITSGWPDTRLATGDRDASEAVWRWMTQRAGEQHLIIGTPIRIAPPPSVVPYRDITWNPDSNTMTNDAGSSPSQ